MARHRNVRTMNYEDEYYDEDDVYGHSVEDNYCVSPATAAQFTFNRDHNVNLSSYMEEGIPEEEEGSEGEHDTLGDSGSGRRHLNLTDIEEGQLNSCLEEVRNVLGETVPEHIMIKTIINHNYSIEAALNELLSLQDAPKPQRQPRQNRRNRSQDDDDNDDFDEFLSSLQTNSPSHPSVFSSDVKSHKEKTDSNLPQPRSHMTSTNNISSECKSYKHSSSEKSGPGSMHKSTSKKENAFKHKISEKKMLELAESTKMLKLDDSHKIISPSHSQTDFPKVNEKTEILMSEKLMQGDVSVVSKDGQKRKQSIPISLSDLAQQHKNQVLEPSLIKVAKQSEKKGSENLVKESKENMGKFMPNISLSELAKGSQGEQFDRSSISEFETAYQHQTERISPSKMTEGKETKSDDEQVNQQEKQISATSLCELAKQHERLVGNVTMQHVKQQTNSMSDLEKKHKKQTSDISPCDFPNQSKVDTLATSLCDSAKQHNTQAASLSDSAKQQNAEATLLSNVAKQHSAQATSLSDMAKQYNTPATSLSDMAKQHNNGATLLSNVAKQHSAQATSLSDMAKQHNTPATSLSDMAKQHNKQGELISLSDQAKQHGKLNTALSLGDLAKVQISVPSLNNLAMCQKKPKSTFVPVVQAKLSEDKKRSLSDLAKHHKKQTKHTNFGTDLVKEQEQEKPVTSLSDLAKQHEKSTLTSLSDLAKQHEKKTMTSLSDLAKQHEKKTMTSLSDLAKKHEKKTMASLSDLAKQHEKKTMTSLSDLAKQREKKALTATCSDLAKQHTMECQVSSLNHLARQHEEKTMMTTCTLSEFASLPIKQDSYMFKSPLGQHSQYQDVEMTEGKDEGGDGIEKKLRQSLCIADNGVEDDHIQIDLLCKPSGVAVTLTRHLQTKMITQSLKKTVKYPKFSYKYQARNLRVKPKNEYTAIVPFDFSTPSPDDIVKQRQSKAFSRTGERKISK